LAVSNLLVFGLSPSPPMSTWKILAPSTPSSGILALVKYQKRIKILTNHKNNNKHLLTLLMQLQMNIISHVLPLLVIQVGQRIWQLHAVASIAHLLKIFSKPKVSLFNNPYLPSPPLLSSPLLSPCIHNHMQWMRS